MNMDGAIDSFGVVRKDNYLAHSIRTIECYIYRTLGFCYNIYTLPRERKYQSRCLFFDRGCIIMLPFDTEERSICEIRLRLAHELGHIVYNIVHNISNLANPELLNDSSDQEEAFCWEFAYKLILCKSEQYSDKDKDYTKFVFTPKQVAANIHGILSRQNQTDIISILKNTLFSPNDL